MIGLLQVNIQAGATPQMEMAMGQKDYEQGQRDGSRGVYKPPFGVFEEFITFGRDAREGARRNADYDRGYRYGKQNPRKRTTT